MIGNIGEDPDRMPDGIPHAVIGLTAFYSVMLAIGLIVMLDGEGLSAVVVLAIALPLVISRLTRKAERERDHIHPSR